MPQAVLILTDTSDGGISARMVLQEKDADKNGVITMSNAQMQAMDIFHQLCPEEAPADIDH